jgi:hypothetical protein
VAAIQRRTRGGVGLSVATAMSVLIMSEPLEGSCPVLMLGHRVERLGDGRALQKSMRAAVVRPGHFAD